MPKFLFKEVDIVVSPGATQIYNSSIGGNLLQIHNRKVANGGTVYIDTRDTVSSTSYLQQIEAGNNGSVVRPYSIATLYFSTDAATNITVTVIEVVADDLEVLFNSSEVLQIQGNVRVQEPLQITNATEATKLDSIITLLTATNTKLDTANTKLQAIIDKP